MSSSSSGNPGTATIVWKSNTYTIHKPSCVSSLVELLSNVRKKCYKGSKTKTVSPSSPLHTSLMTIIETYATTKYKELLRNNDNSILWNPQQIKSRDKVGVYLLSTKKVGSTTTSLMRRTTEQNPEWATTLVHQKDLRTWVPDSTVDQIVNLGLPGLLFHTDHDSYKKDLIRVQLVEMFLACFYCSTTQTVCERLFQLPSRRVLFYMTVPTNFSQRIIDFVGWLEENSVWCFHTWATLRSVLQTIAEDPTADPEVRTILQQRLRQLPPNGGYITANRFMELFGSKFECWKDCMTTSPREDDLQKCLAGIQDPTTDNSEALKFLQGENYSHYIRPSSKELGSAAQTLLHQTLIKDQLSTSKSVVIERCTVDALRKNQPGVWESTVDLSSEIHLLPKMYGLSLLHGKKDSRRFFKVPSFFMMFAENVPKKVRFRIIKAYLTLLQLLYESGNITADRFTTNRNLLCTFMMALDFGNNDDDDDDDDSNQSSSNSDSNRSFMGDDDELVFEEFDVDVSNEDSEDDDDDDDDDDNDDLEIGQYVQDTNTNAPEPEVLGFRLARLLALPDGYCKGAVSNVLGVSKALKIGHCETLYLRIKMTKEQFNQFLVSQGVLQPGQKESPIETTFTCPGYEDGQPCPYHDSNPNQPIWKFKNDDVFYCRPCHKKMHYQHRFSTGDERKSNRGFERRLERNVFAGNEEAIEWKDNKSNYLAARYRNEKAKGKIVTSTGSGKKRKGKVRYPSAIEEKMAIAALKWIKLIGEPFVMWPDMVALLSDIVCNEQPTYRDECNTDKKLKKLFEFDDDNGGALYYYVHGFEYALRDVLERPEPITKPNGVVTYSKQWTVKNYDSLNIQPRKVSGSKDEKQQVRATILAEMYPPFSHDENEENDDDDENDDQEEDGPVKKRGLSEATNLLVKEQRPTTTKRQKTD